MSKIDRSYLKIPLFGIRVCDKWGLEFRGFAGSVPKGTLRRKPLNSKVSLARNRFSKTGISSRIGISLALLTIIFCSPKLAWAFDDLEARWTLDLSYHYARIERATTIGNINFLSRSGAMMQFEYTRNLSLFWRYYLGGDFAYSSFEGPGANTITPREIFPWQVYGGIAAQFGDLKNLEFFLGAGTSTEFYQRLTAVETYSLDQTYSLRAHIGFTYRLISIVGSTAKIMARYSLPVTTVEHFNEPLRYNGILDGTLRVRPSYNSTLSFYGGIRFEDFQTFDESITYFGTRIHVGFGLHF